MEIVDLAKHCVDSINHPERSLPDKPLVTLVWTTGKNPFPRKGWPRPKHLLSDLGGQKIQLYDATDMLAALVAHGCIEAKFETQEVSA